MNEATFVCLRSALSQFAEATRHQTQEHIRPLHWHIACRLVIEGGFHPSFVTPRPPLAVETRGAGRNRRHHLSLDYNAAHAGEQTVLGGLKTKSVDVVVSTRTTGPSLAISVKGTLNAFRNLTNRMAEAAGDCTNLHIVYPALVYGFLHVLKANRQGDVQRRNDVALFDDGEVAEDIKRYHDAMVRLAGRSDVRNDASRYESVALALVDTSDGTRGDVMSVYPRVDSELRLEEFFERLYDTYDLRFVYSAPSLRSKTERFVWDSHSPVIPIAESSGFRPRLAAD